MGTEIFQAVFITMLVFTGVPLAAAGSGIIGKIADTATPVPGGSGTFTAFGTPSGFGFSADFVGGRGVYSLDPATFVDSSVSIPSGSGHFTGFSAPNGLGVDMGGGAYGVIALVFQGGGASGQGIYDFRPSGPTLTVVADTSTPMPGGGGDFGTFFVPSVTHSISESVAFRANNNGGSVTGIYLQQDFGSGLLVVANNSTYIPGTTLGEKFVSFGDPVIDFPSTTFIGTGATQQGVYRTAGPGSLLAVWDKSTLVPGGGGNFTGFSHLSRHGPLAFVGNWGTSSAGVFTSTADTQVLGKVADDNTPIPDGVGDFISFSATGCSYGVGDGIFVAFQAAGTGGQSGIYAQLASGPLLCLVSLDTPIDGKTIASLAMADNAVTGDNVYFKATFTDGSSGIYSAYVPVPEPSAAIVGGGMITLVFLRRRRRAPAP